MHRLADGVVPAEGEREVRDAARDEHARTALLEERDRVDERLRECCVLLDAGRDREHVRVEDDVLREEAGLLREQVVCPAEDLDLPLDALRLALLVERHHDDAGAVAADRPRLLEEALLPLLQRDGVDDALALHALEPRLERREARAVHHEREPRGLGLGRDQVQECRHRLLRVEQVGVHVHVQQVGAASHLLERDVDRSLVVVRLDQPAEARGARHVRPLSDHDEPGVRIDDEGLEPREAREAPALGQAARRQPLDRAGDLARVLRGRPTAPADEVHEAVLRERAQEAARVARLLVVESELVREAGVRMA